MIERIFLKQGLKHVQLEKYLKSELDKAGFTEAEVVKTPLVTRIVVNVTRPGLAIGKSGQNIKHLTETIQEKFGIENPQLEIKEIEKPELDAKSMAEKMKTLIERGFSWRSVAFRTLRDILNAGAEGVEIVVSGKIAGKSGRKRKQRIAQGYMKKTGDLTRLVEYGKASAYPKVGAIGIKVRIVRPDTVFPDKIDLENYLTKKSKELEEEKEETKEEDKTEEKSEVKKEEVKEKPKTETKKEETKIEEKPKEEKKEVKEETK